MIDVRELQDRIDGMYARPGSEEGRAEIGDTYDGHVTEVWQDGEVTSTKNGDLYGARSLHQRSPPFLPSGQCLFPPEIVDNDWEEYDKIRRHKENVKMVVIDDELLEILDEYRDFTVNKEVIDQHDG